MISDGEQEIDYDARVTKRRVRVPIVSDDNSDICRIGVRMPPFWPEKPLLWFSQIESQFCISKITDDDIKFHFLITNLDRRYISDIEDLITSPPTTGKPRRWAIANHLSSCDIYSISRAPIYRKIFLDHCGLVDSQVICRLSSCRK
ncbi:uncharacterized protein LOC123722312 [Papilio machaon]|uniref:uncharacterized protein LOC123722312 n=1 Tax=Papilio machaon TaxID=76193 RepID=UPI001E665B9B|nr:uncharacterized protein LOC123722312 [Papilio machaon]